MSGRDIVRRIFKILEMVKNGTESSFQESLDLLEEMVFYTDREGKLYYANKLYADFLGEALENIIGKREGDFLDEDIAERCLENSRLAYDNKMIYREEELGGRKYLTFKSRIELGNCDAKIFTMIKEITEKKNSK